MPEPTPQNPAPAHGRIVPSNFRPAWWLPGPHLQTMWPTLTRARPALSATRGRRRIELADGDFIDLSIGVAAGAGSASNSESDHRPAPRVLIVHGLEGDLRSHYAGSLFARLGSEGFTPIFMHLRGSGDEPNRLDRSYHSGASEDLAAVLAALAADPEGLPIAAIGFSLGGNLLLKYLGERPAPLLPQAIAVSVPFVLRDAMLRLGQGPSRIYQRHLITRLKAGFCRKFRDRPLPAALDPGFDLDAIQDFNQFDDQVTAPLNGFAGVFDYYQRCACRQFLPAIRTPTLIIHARDDPFMYPQTIPCAHELGPGVTLELSEHGGHVGFIAGNRPGQPVWWLEDRIIAALRAPGHST